MIAVLVYSPPQFPWVYAEWLDENDEPVCVCAYPSGGWDNLIDKRPPGPEDIYADRIEDYWAWHWSPTDGPLHELRSVDEL